MTTYLLITAVVIFACVFLSKVSSRLGIPMLLAFILLGMLFGSDGILKIPFDNYAFAEQICTVALIFIMFYGGFGTNWQQAKAVAGKAVIDGRSCDNSCTYRSFLSLCLTYRMGGKYADRCTDRFHRCGVRILSAAIKTAESAL